MAIGVENKDNIQPADSNYPKGQIRDESPTVEGTPVDVKTYGDFHQFFEKMMIDAGLEPNGIPDNDYNGYQLFQALKRVMNNQLYKAKLAATSAVFSSTANLTTPTGIIQAVRVGQKIDIDFVFKGTTIASGGAQWTVQAINEIFRMSEDYSYTAQLYFPQNSGGDDSVQIFPIPGDNQGISVDSNGYIGVNIGSDTNIPISTIVQCWGRISGSAKNIVFNEKDY